ncbi:MAG: HipA domain-containing protein [Candidatus Marinimicrobia bacterium]|nr:HipA domain-containing protein [Candidatus Neomarinimicrobiota bacterium]
MNRCPITYEPCKGKYSKTGLAKLSPRLTELVDLPFTAQEQRREAASRATKTSIQGVQPKLSARLSVKSSSLEIVDIKGTFILKPQSDIFREVPENEDVTMKMAKILGIDVPLTGLVFSKDGSLSYFIKRFDRYGTNKKKHLEDFAQLTNNTRETKYNWSMEKLIPVIDSNCTFPLIEKRKLFRRMLFCFLIGNEDMHLKNFSLIMHDNIIELSPAYDLLNSTISMERATEEFALPLAGKKRKITRKDLVTYFGMDWLRLTGKTIESEIQNIKDKKSDLESLIHISFLTKEMKEKYLELMSNRYERLME